MTKTTLKTAVIEDEKARRASFKRRTQSLIKKVHELTILCNVAACLLIFNRDDNKMTVWPSPEVAQSLIDRFFALPFLTRNVKAMDQASLINHNIELIEKKLAKVKKVINDLEMDDLLLQLQMGHRKMVNLTTTEIHKLMTYAQEQIQATEREMESRGHGNTSFNETSLWEKTPNVQNHSNGESSAHQTQAAHGLNLNLVPSDGEKHEDD